MIKVLYLTGFLILSSCSTKVRLSEMKHTMITKYPVKDRSEALRLIQSRYNFLKLLFEQSREPYYGDYKWSEECLKANKIGAVVDNGSSITMNSSLFLDSKLESGFCPGGGAYRYNVIFEWCEGAVEVTEYKIPFNQRLLEGHYLKCQ